MNQQQLANLRRRRAEGHTLKWLREKYGLTMAEVRDALGLPKIVTRPKLSEEDRAIAQLRREGYSEDVIRANFG